VFIALSVMSPRCGLAHPTADGIGSADHAVRASTYFSLQKHRKETAETLCKVLAASSDDAADGSRTLAISFLGELRAAEGVDCLVDHLDFVPQGGPRSGGSAVGSRMTDLPAAVALVKIGIPAVEAMVSVVRNDADAQHRDVAAWALREILGPREALGRLQDRYPAGDSRLAPRFDAAISKIEDTGDGPWPRSQP
jgi:hypothetical protein